MELPKKIDFQILKGWLDSRTEQHPLRVVAKADLRKVAGGLYRIRDDYTSVWSMHDEDGRSYIIRADDDSGDMMVVADEQTPSSPRMAHAYRIFTAGDVHVVWECNECDSPNISKQGEQYECGNCHVETPDVFAEEGPQQAGVTMEDAVAKYGPEAGAFMKKYAITRADVALLEAHFGRNAQLYDTPAEEARQHRLRDWYETRHQETQRTPEEDDQRKKQWQEWLKSRKRERAAAEGDVFGGAQKCEKCNRETEGTKLCLDCSPKGTLFKKNVE